MSATSWLVCLATFICAVVEDIKGLHCSRAPLFISEYQIDPFMQMSRHVLWLLNTDKYHLHQQTVTRYASLRIDPRPESARTRLGKTWSSFETFHEALIGQKWQRNWEEEQRQMLRAGRIQLHIAPWRLSIEVSEEELWWAHQKRAHQGFAVLVDEILGGFGPFRQDDIIYPLFGELWATQVKSYNREREREWDDTI